MAWMLLEELLKATMLWLVSFFLKNVRRCLMSENCLTPNCFGNAAMRGLCLKCYSKAKYKVDNKEITWDELVKHGLCLEAKDPFDSAYERAMEGK